MTISYTPWRKWRRFTWRLQWWSMLTEGPGQWLLVAALWATLHSAVATAWYQIILCICMTPSSYAIVYTENTSTLIMVCKTQLRHKYLCQTFYSWWWDYKLKTDACPSSVFTELKLQCPSCLYNQRQSMSPLIRKHVDIYISLFWACNKMQ